MAGLRNPAGLHWTWAAKLPPMMGFGRSAVGQAFRLKDGASSAEMANQQRFAMQAQQPHFLLFSEACGPSSARDGWRFVLQSVGGDERLSASDTEPDAPRGRLELLAVVRGLEALDQPSRVTLLTRSRYVHRGVRRGLSQWRERGWQWERFGKLVPIRDHNLWRRLDRALGIHEVACCPWQWGEALSTPLWDATASPSPSLSEAVPTKESAVVIVPRRDRRHRRGGVSRQLERLGQWGLAAWGPAFTRPA